MKRSFAYMTTVVTICGLAVFSACDDVKDEVISIDEDMETAENGTVADNTVDEDLHYFDEVTSLSGEGGRLAEDPCVTITRDTTAKKITLDFGTGCVGPYGRERSGKVFIYYTSAFAARLSPREITFEDYEVNNKGISGLIKLSGITRNNDGYLSGTRELVGYTVTFPNGNSVELNGSTTRELIEGEADAVIGNEVFRVTGGYEGSTSTGREFTRTITVPIIADFNCQADGGFLRTEGKQEMAFTNVRRSRTRSIDYGTGDCDNEITLTVNGQSYTITFNQ